MDFSNVTNGILRYIDTWEQKLIDLPVDTITKRGINKTGLSNRYWIIWLILLQIITNAWFDYSTTINLTFPIINRIMTCGSLYRIIKMLIGILRFSCRSITICT